jgi:hypothetical protein
VRLLSARYLLDRPIGREQQRRRIMSYVDGFVIAVPKDNLDA